MNILFGAKLQSWQVDATGAAALIALGAACYFFLAEPMLNRQAIARAQGVELAAERESLTRLRASRQDAEARLLDVRASVSAQSVHLEPRAHVNQRLDTLTKLAAASGIGVQRLAPGPSADGPRHGTMTLHLSGKADYQACETFVAQLHESFNDTAIITMRLASVPASDEPVTLELELLWFTAPDVKVPSR